MKEEGVARAKAHLIPPLPGAEPLPPSLQPNASLACRTGGVRRSVVGAALQVWLW